MKILCIWMDILLFFFHKFFFLFFLATCPSRKKILNTDLFFPSKILHHNLFLLSFNLPPCAFLTIHSLKNNFYSHTFLKLFFLFIDSRKREREGERERNIDWLLLVCASTETKPSTQACALT